MSASLIDAAFDWIGEGAGRPKYCLPFTSRPPTTLPPTVDSWSFGDPDTSGVHDSVILDPPLEPLLAPVNGMLWKVPASTADPEILPHWPRLKRIDGSFFGPRQTPAVLQEHDLLLEVWPAAFRRLEYLFSSLEVPASFADWELPQMPAPRWFWIRGAGDTQAVAQVIADAQFAGSGLAPDVTKWSEGKIPLLVRAGDTLTLAEDPVEFRAFDHLGLVMDPDFVFATFRQLALDSDFSGLSVQPPGSITWDAPDRQIIVVSDAAGKPYFSAGDPDSQPVLVPARELVFPGTSVPTTPIPGHGVVVIDGMPVDPNSPLTGIELPGEHQRLSLSPHGTLAKRITGSLSNRSFFRLQVSDFAAWFPKTPNPRNESAGADSFNRYTDGNEVIPLIDGQAMLREVYRALRATHVLESYDSDDHVPALDPNATPAAPDPGLKAKAKIFLTNAWIYPETAMLGRRALNATSRTQVATPPEPEDLVGGFRVVPVFYPEAPGEPADPAMPNAIWGSDSLEEYRLWVLIPNTPLPPGTFVGLKQIAFASAIHGDDPNVPGATENADIYGVIAPLEGATTSGFAGSSGFFALRAFYKLGETPQARLHVVSWIPDPEDPDPGSIATAGKGEKRVRMSGDVELPLPASTTQAPDFPVRLEFDGTLGRAIVLIEQGALQAAQPVVVINTRSGEVHGEVVGPNNTEDVRITVEPFALRDWILIGLGGATPDPAQCELFYALSVSEAQFQSGSTVGHPTEVIGALQEAMIAGIDTRLLAWRGFDEYVSKRIFGATGTVATLNAGVGGHRGQAIHDSLFRRENAVHHQKGAFIRAAKPVADGGGAMAFLGGIDLMSTRWDTSLHKDIEPDRQSDPWHDIHCRVRGRAVWDVYRNFRQRWNAALDHPELVGDDPGWTPAPSIDDVGAFEPNVESLGSVTLQDGPCTVQINRTIAPRTEAYNGFLNRDFGDLSVEKSYRRAIQTARRFIYIEDQYFWFKEMAQHLHDALFEKRIDFLMLLLPKDLHEFPTADLLLYAQRRKLISLLLYGNINGTPGGPHDVSDRVVVFGIVNEARSPLYVHCKSMVVDDLWCSISSSNFSRRSMTYDSEIGAMSIDKRTRRGGQKLARDFRVELMAAHLGLEPEERPLVEDPYEAFQLYKDYLDGNLTGMSLNIAKFGIAQMDLLHTHYGIQPAEVDGTLVDGVNAIADPDGRVIDQAIGLLDVRLLMEALDQSTEGNVFGGIGSLRISFDVSTIGPPGNVLVAVSILEEGKTEASRVGLGRFPATSTVNAGVMKVGLTYHIRAIASLTFAPDQAVAQEDVDINTTDAAFETTITFN